MRDLLDTVTLVHEALRDDQRQRNWVRSIETIFDEEELQYRVDNDGIVHFAVDEAHEVVRQSTIRALQDRRFEGVVVAFQRANDALLDPQSGPRPLRETFEAAEILFKLMFSRAPRLGAKEIRDHLEPLVAQAYGNDPVAQRSAQRLVASFREWVEAAHHYRHGQPQEAPVGMPAELQILAMNEGAAFIRWLAGLAQLDGGSEG
ncbi:hypothetical protein VQ042_12905 [Aurantimonas sp. A2-1-M11]|uniref:hypothetical protein n=1 Tax=Aurantimonas sp. A2-1-M11 TaxID=3113712 RepID=UPI002F9415B9